MNKKTCCVTGRKDIPIQQINYEKDSLHYEIDQVIAEDYTCFMCGSGDGVDQYFAEIVVEGVVYFGHTWAILMNGKID